MKTILPLRLAAAAAGLFAGFALPLSAQPAGPAGFGPPRGGPMLGAEVKLRAKFDRDGNKLLDADERAAAREYLAANPIGRGPGGRGGPGRRGGPPGFGGERETPTAGERIAPADVKTYGDESLFDATTLRTLFFTFDADDWEKQMEEFRPTDIELPARLVVDGREYRDVGVGFRGASSYMMVGSGSKRSLGVSIDLVHENQHLLGQRTLNLLNSHGDASFLRAALYSHVAQNYLPTPRVNFVRVVINGENWGVYASAEQFNKDFTQSRFNTTKGARWKVPGSPGGRGSLAYLGDDPAAYKGIYEIKSKDDVRSWNRLITLCRVLQETPPEQLEAALAPLLDVDGALKFLALENAFVNADGYWTRTSDYSIAEDEKGRLHIVPHDMNETFSFGGGPGGRGGPRGPGGFGGPGGNTFGPPEGRGGPEGGFRRGGPGGGGGGGIQLDPLASAGNETAPLAAKLLAVPALRTRYLGLMREMAETWLDWSRLGPVAREIHALIDADVKRDTRKLSSYEAFTASLATDTRSLKAFADQRRAFLLAHPAVKASQP
ncbi:MAG: CotH kinase family protein [Opitutaceae bacterium]|nr:CotH kinase family protein [Opitutaceae bacterium]